MATTKTRAGGGGEEEEEEEEDEEEEIITNNSAVNESKSNTNIINNENEKVEEGKEEEHDNVEVEEEEEEEEEEEASSGREKGGGGEGQEEEEDQRWGTWEELLLACAVKRHGFKAWDSVSMELQTRTTLPPPLTTPRHCQLKYDHLKRRFSFNNQDPDLDPDPDQGPDSLAIPWLHHLRELRVAELRRELRHYDDSIQSLQLKVKRLEEEREQSQSLSSKENQRPDLADSSKEDRSQQDKTLADTKPLKSALRSAAGEESDRENRSVNESNSTGVKSEREREGDEIGIEEAEKKPEVVAEAEAEVEMKAEAEGKGTGSEWKPEGMESYNGSSESKRKRSGEVVADSVEEVKEEEENRSSDVESSASLNKRKRKGRRIGEDEAEAEAEPLTDVKFQPLDDLLTKIRAHQHSSLFQRRLPIQESDKYQNIVRQPMDLDDIRKKLRRGSYASCTLAFYRDLLLLFNNALVFYPKSSLESNTAHELMRIVLPEIKKNTTKHPSSSTTLRQDTSLSAPKPELDRSDSLLAKHKSSAPIIVCRKRSSISAKPSSSTFGQKTEPRNEEKKHSVDSRPPAKPASSSASPQEQSLIKINTKERSITGTRSLRRSNNNNNNKNIKTVPAPPAPPAKKQGSTPTSGSTDKADTSKGDQKKSEAVSSTKKRSAADFLKRIKRNSPVGKTKNSGHDPNPKGGKGGSGSGGGDQKKKQSGKAEKGEEKEAKQSGGGGGSSSGGAAKHGREESASSPSKKNVGRPPKKGAEPPKRGRDDGGKEAVKRPRKRSRR